jgi:hypothetical protein
MSGALVLKGKSLFATDLDDASIGPFRTPYRYGKLVLAASGSPDAFDSKLVDDPIVFRHESGFYMLYIGFDGQGYQTGPTLCTGNGEAASQSAIRIRSTHATTWP